MPPNEDPSSGKGAPHDLFAGDSCIITTIPDDEKCSKMAVGISEIELCRLRLSRATGLEGNGSLHDLRRLVLITLVLETYPLKRAYPATKIEGPSDDEYLQVASECYWAMRKNNMFYDCTGQDNAPLRDLRFELMGQFMGTFGWKMRGSLDRRAA